MSNRWLYFLLLLPAFFLIGCALDELNPPPVSAALIAKARPIHADGQTLSHGYALFVSRCLDCHTLPPTTKYSKDEWPYLVSRMANRARLSNSDQAALIAYLRTASTTAP
jgi:mono/diheme cytochrome c family protein